MLSRRRKLAVAVLFLALTGCGLPRGLQDRLDRRHLRRHFDIPRGAELVSYEGYPSTVGFGQREGLSISAVYALTDEQEGTFVRVALSGDWQRLPMPEVERDRARWLAGNVPLELERGVYLARTAGDDVLRAEVTEPVMSVERPRDLILGVLDTETNRLYVRVASGY